MKKVIPIISHDLMYVIKIHTLNLMFALTASLIILSLRNEKNLTLEEC